MGGDGDAVGGHRAVGGSHGVGPAAVDADRAAVLVDPAVERAEALDQGEEVAAGMELGLVVEAEGGFDGIGEGRLLDQGGRQACVARGVDLAFELGAVPAFAHIDVVGLATEVAPVRAEARA